MKYNVFIIQIMGVQNKYLFTLLLIKLVYIQKLDYWRFYRIYLNVAFLNYNKL